MNGVAIGAVLAVMTMAWVLMPILRGRRGAESPGVLSPRPTECPACAGQAEQDAMFCSSCGRSLRPAKP
jgi:hypothetical protein